MEKSPHRLYLPPSNQNVESLMRILQNMQAVYQTVILISGSAAGDFSTGLPTVNVTR
jgi:hypothetical protein